MDKNLYRRMMDQAVPSAALIQKTKQKMRKEEPVMIKRTFSMATAVAMAVLLLSTTALAAWYFLKPSEVAEKLENPALSAAFDGPGAININKSVTSGGYTFTLLAIVSGKDISDQPYYNNSELRNDRSYVVTAIQRADGAPMPSYGQDGFTPFYISPYIQGQKPWLVNAHTLGGGTSEAYVDGVLYRLVEFDNITMFADRGVYIGIIDGQSPNNQAFLINEQTGGLSVNPGHNGISILFDLSIDPSLANPEKARAFLDALLGDGSEAMDEVTDTNTGETATWVDDNITAAGETAMAGAWSGVNWDNAVPVPSTVKELTVSEAGVITYTFNTDKYGGGTITAEFSDIFVKNQKAQSVIMNELASDDTVYAIRFTMDESGVIKGMVVVPSN